MKEIPTRKIAELFDGKNAFLLRMPGHHFPPGERSSAHLEHAHRDDYYIFLLIRKGSGKGMIDFREYAFEANSLYCILPGQVHEAMGDVDIDCWFLAVDRVLVKSGYKDIFEKKSFSGVCTKPGAEETEELCALLSLIDKRLRRNEEAVERSVLQDLISAYIGLVADLFRKEVAATLDSRAARITLQFKSLLSENYDTLKRPSQYAQRMNLSLVYLNEVIKKTTGSSVSECIRDEIVLHAKRLLFYTNLTVKDISLKLGYGDWAYFTRLFGKATGLSPTQFRKENLDPSNSNSR